jgi:hypothetical protein
MRPSSHLQATDLGFAFRGRVDRFAEDGVGGLHPRFAESGMRVDGATEFLDG